MALMLGILVLITYWPALSLAFPLRRNAIFSSWFVGPITSRVVLAPLGPDMARETG